MHHILANGAMLQTRKNLTAPNYEEIWKAAFMFNAVLARAASTEGSREDIIEMLSSDTEKLLDLIWRLTH